MRNKNACGDLIVGMMSGTSADGIDAALVEFHSDTHLAVLGTRFTPFSDVHQRQINNLAQQIGKPQAKAYAELDTSLAQQYARAAIALLKQCGVAPNSVRAIANHGQTIAHDPSAQPPYSLQIGNPQLIANVTGITTIAQFRQADLALGGQGAPLMPAFHQAIFGIIATARDASPQQSTLILNLGGIANLSLLDPSKVGAELSSARVIGFDTGPANTLLNQWIFRHKQLSFDEGGCWAESGEIVPELLAALLSEQYFSAPAPKSTGPNFFNLAWLESKANSLGLHSLDDFRPQDIQATLLELTVVSIANAAHHLLEINSGKLYVCGGGAHNAAMMRSLARHMPKFKLANTDQLGVPADWVEAVGFAWLGYCNLHNKASNLPSVTGATKATTLGQRFTPQQTHA